MWNHLHIFVIEEFSNNLIWSVMLPVCLLPRIIYSKADILYIAASLFGGQDYMS
jgi:hypothetical protein